MRYCGPCHEAARLTVFRRSHAHEYYNLTLEEKEALLEDGCEVCGSMVRLVVDHNHATGAVRGPLCSRCNVGIGMLGDDPERLEEAARYLRRKRGF